jgi:P27 family predicted phage terminase small subunit
LRGNPNHERIPRGEIQPAPFEGIPEPPKRLGAYAREEWIRIAPELHRLGILTIADLRPLACYCQAYEKWCEADDAMAVCKANDPLYSGLLVRGRVGEWVPNPLVKMQAEASRDLLRLSCEFGFTPASRTRVIGTAASDEHDRKFSGLLAHQS